MKSTILGFLEDHYLSWAAFQPSDLVFRDVFLRDCAANHCGKYGKTWTCPPGIGDVNSHRSRLSTFPEAILFQQVFPLEDPYDVDGMDVGRKTIMNHAYTLSDRLRKEPGEAMFLAAGSCELCHPCSYPEKPCRFPEKAMISMEALGVDVYDIAKKTGLKYYHGPNTVTYFVMVFFREGSPCRP